MSEEKESRLTQSFLGLSDQAFHAVPPLQQRLTETINRYIDDHQVSTGTVVTALAFVIGECIMMSGDEAEQSKAWFSRILDAYVHDGIDGARVGRGQERSLVRKQKPWPTVTD
jgi:hypothetical protein